MGLIKALAGAAGSTMADQWKEYFYCDSLSSDVLVTKGQKRTSSRSSNTKGSDNIISNGSGIVVADGQCMIIVDHGKVAELCAEPGQFTYNSSTEPSLFTGPLGTSLKETFKTIGKRFTFGGDTGHDQRVYYFNTKEILDNKFGTANPVPFRVVDSKIGFDIDVTIRCSGVYSYRIADPMKFYANVCGNVEGAFTRDKLDTQLKTEFISALQPSFGKLSAMELRPNQIVSHTADLEDALNEVLSKKWKEARGLEVATVAIGSLSLPQDQQEMLQQAQKAAFYANPAYGAGNLNTATAEAMKTAAANTNGAMAGFMGMGMTQGLGGNMMGNLYGMAAQQSKEAPKAAAKPSWKCSCGAENTGKFCSECGQPKPEKKTWTCSCGTVNTGKFCSECGKPMQRSYRCSKCGWVPEDPANPPKFCPECGDRIGDEDLV